MGTTTKGLHLYFDYISQPSRALWIILKVSGKLFEEHHINLLEGEHFNDEYKQNANRFQKVPAIIDDGFRLAESVAILRYLSNKEFILEYLYPEDLHIRARVDEFLQWQHLGVRSSCSLYFRFAWVQSKVLKSPAEAGKILKYKLEMERDLKTMDEVWLAKTKFLAGNTITAADVFGACEVLQICVTGYDIDTKFPKVSAWIKSVRAELNPYFDQAHSTIYKYEKETKSNL